MGEVASDEGRALGQKQRIIFQQFPVPSSSVSTSLYSGEVLAAVGFGVVESKAGVSKALRPFSDLTRPAFRGFAFRATIVVVTVARRTTGMPYLRLLFFPLGPLRARPVRLPVSLRIVHDCVSVKGWKLSSALGGKFFFFFFLETIHRPPS